jgi:hypothetical protein
MMHMKEIEMPLWIEPARNANPERGAQRYTPRHSERVKRVEESAPPAEAQTKSTPRGVFAFMQALVSLFTLFALLAPAALKAQEARVNVVTVEDRAVPVRLMGEEMFRGARAE